MSDATLRRWLVPGLAVACIALPLLAGGCFDETSPEWEWLRDCTDEEPLPPGARLTPEQDLPPVPQQQLGRETGPGSGQATEEAPPGETAEGETGEGTTPPNPPFRPRIPEGVLQPRPDPNLQRPSPTY